MRQNPIKCHEPLFRAALYLPWRGVQSNKAPFYAAL